MQNFSYEEALQNFSHLLEDVTTHHEVITVQDSNRRTVVMLSQDDYESISGLHPFGQGQDPAEQRSNNLDGWL